MNHKTNPAERHASMALGLMRQVDIELSKLIKIEREDLDAANAKLLLAEAIEVLEKRQATGGI